MCYPNIEYLISKFIDGLNVRFTYIVFIRYYIIINYFIHHLSQN